MDERLACDYLSCFRQMAQRVPIPADTSTSRRRTRRRQQSLHYFDQIFRHQTQGNEMAQSLNKLALIP